MRLSPRRVNRVVWEEGMFLAPQHFQAQRRHFEESLGHTIEALFPFGYGITAAALDTEALGGGSLALSHARGIFPDGTVVAIPEADPPPPAAPLAERFSPTRDAHVVLLTLPAWRSDGANVTGLNGGVAGFGLPLVEPAERHDDARYEAVAASVRDETSGEDATEIHFATKRLRLRLDVEMTPGEVALPLARIRRDGAGRFVVDSEYVPPALQIGASDRLLDMLRTVIGMLEAKGASLGASLGPAGGAQRGMGGPAAYVGNELATRWLLHAVRSAEAPLRHLLATRRAHPEKLWLELSRLSGALCTFSLTTQARDLPAYAHEDLGGCFGALERHLRTHLDVVVAAKAVVIPLARGDDGLFGARITDARCFAGGARWFLGVRSSLPPHEMVARAPQLLKVCARKFVLELVRRAFPGLVLEHVPSPPPGLAPRRELAYFEIVRAGPCSQGLDDTREIGVHAPDALSDLALELAVLAP